MFLICQMRWTQFSSTVTLQWTQFTFFVTKFLDRGLCRNLKSIILMQMAGEKKWVLLVLLSWVLEKVVYKNLFPRLSYISDEQSVLFLF